MPTRVTGSPYTPSYSGVDPSRQTVSQPQAGPVQSAGYAATSSFSGADPYARIDFLDSRTKDLADGLDGPAKDLVLNALKVFGETRLAHIKGSNDTQRRVGEGEEQLRMEDVGYTTYKRFATKAADSVKALLDPEKARQYLTRGLVDENGGQLAGPPSNPTIRALLEKVASGGKLSPEEIKKGVSAAKDGLMIDNYEESMMWQQFSQQLEEAQKKALEAMKENGE